MGIYLILRDKQWKPKKKTRTTTNTRRKKSSANSPKKLKITLTIYAKIKQRANSMSKYLSNTSLTRNQYHINSIRISRRYTKQLRKMTK